MRAMKTILFVGLGLLTVVAGCRGNAGRQEPALAPGAQGAAASAEQEGSGASAVAGVSWQVPAGWTVQPTSGMRYATYAIPAAEGAGVGECAVYYFGPDQGGTVNANVTRWEGQFEGHPSAERATRSAGGLQVTTVELHGTYLSPGGPMMQSQGRAPNTTLLGLIVEGPDGPVFFKCVGPEQTMKAARSAFDALAGSLKEK